MRKTKAGKLHTSNPRDLRQCENKRKFPSKQAAKSGVRIARDRGEQLHPYPCGVCKGWHVGH